MREKLRPRVAAMGTDIRKAPTRREEREGDIYGHPQFELLDRMNSDPSGWKKVYEEDEKGSSEKEEEEEPRVPMGNQEIEPFNRHTEHDDMEIPEWKEFNPSVCHFW
ncbi:hypothetical protein WR25_04861 [Diploscapter pachys]|uniref:Uncharacterized protein n=1 Tax=Diploscapter pachys TaxID=2018661 RepID=A0A2A2LXA1_9BILA|nr:hypothetical protein WR25_04861 [Diploscapter pachys]